MPQQRRRTILRNGRIWCGRAIGFVEALAISGKRVLAAGRAADLEALVEPSSRIIDLGGRLALPGFCDAHMHLLPLGLAQRELDVRPEAAPDMAALLDRVRARAASAAPGAWIFGRGYDHFLLPERRHPTRDELDAAAPANPVYLKRCCGHMGVANSRALALAGIGDGAPDPDGGHIDRDAHGRPTGLLQERAQAAVFNAMPPPGEDDLVQAIEDGGRLLIERGITAAMDAGVGMRAGIAEYDAYQRARAEGRLPVRAYLCFVGGPGGAAEAAQARGLKTGMGDSRLRIGPVKIFTDGSAGGRTAAMTEPYRGDGDERGILCLADDEMAALARDYHVWGFQLAVHAIGDAAIDQTIAAVEGALDAAPADDRRHRIEHCGFIRPDQIAAMKRLGMVPVAQPVFMRQFGDAYIDALGEERPAAAYPMASWIRAGLRPAASSDAPVSDFDPFLTLYAAITRRAASGRVIGADERIGVAEALETMTWNGAYACFAEDERGALAPGKFADVAVVSTDLFACAPEEVLDARCDITIFDGAIVFDRQGEIAD